MAEINRRFYAKNKELATKAYADSSFTAARAYADTKKTEAITESETYTDNALVNYLAKNNTTAYTPSGAYNPATKMYVDSSVQGVETQYTTMPTADASNVGKVVQYVGDTNPNYEKGHFYECVSDGEDPATYSWEELNVQQPGGQAEVMPEPSVDNEGQIIQYTGESTEDLEQGHFYECVEDPDNPGEYIWKEINVQDIPEIPDFTKYISVAPVDSNGNLDWNQFPVQTWLILPADKDLGHYDSNGNFVAERNLYNFEDSTGSGRYTAPHELRLINIYVNKKSFTQYRAQYINFIHLFYNPGWVGQETNIHYYRASGTWYDNQDLTVPNQYAPSSLNYSSALTTTWSMLNSDHTFTRRQTFDNYAPRSRITASDQYDLVNKKYVDNAVSGSLNREIVYRLPTQNISEKTIYMLETGHPTLPDEYQPVEYLESHGTEYIDTGYNARAIAGIWASILNPNVSTANGILCGGGDSTNYFQIQCCNNSTMKYAEQSANISNDYFTDKEQVDIGLFYNQVQIDNDSEVYVFTNSEAETDYSYYLFAGNSEGTPVDFGSYKLTRAFVYDDPSDTDVRRFYPCYRKADKEPGLYDLYTKTFFTNQGTGKFDVGPIVPNHNSYTEYMYINHAWEEIGSTDIDLSDYATKEYVDEKVPNFFKGPENEWNALTPAQQRDILFAAVISDDSFELTPEEEEDLTSSLGTDSDIEVDMSLNDALDAALVIADGN